MNSTKIVGVVCEKTVDAAVQCMQASQHMVDLFELRLDFLADIFEDISFSAFSQLVASAPLPLIIANRTKCDGGQFCGNETTRIAFLHKALELNVAYIDLEFSLPTTTIQDFIVAKKAKKTKIILSYHNLNETPSSGKLTELYYSMKKCCPDLIKIVTFAQSINDVFTTFCLLRNKKNLIAFCTGQRGTISRILCKKYGSVFTYGSLSKQNPVIGMINIRDMISSYNLSMINPKTKVYGIISQYPEHSLSPHMYNALFRRKKTNAVFLPFKVSPNELPVFMKHFHECGFAGASVTIPNKIALFKYLDHVDGVACTIGAVNTVVNKNSKFIGYNTDWCGALQALKYITVLRGKTVLVFGAGGAAHAVVYGLTIEGAQVTIIDRTPEKAELLAKKFKTAVVPKDSMKEAVAAHDIIVNATSVGMLPHDDESLLTTDDFVLGKIVMDVVYQPLLTKFLRLAQQSGCQIITGEIMFIHQAIAQVRLLTGQNITFHEAQNFFNRFYHD